MRNVRGKNVHASLLALSPGCSQFHIVNIKNEWPGTRLTSLLLQVLGVCSTPMYPNYLSSHVQVCTCTQYWVIKTIACVLNAGITCMLGVYWTWCARWIIKPLLLIGHQQYDHITLALSCLLAQTTSLALTSDNVCDFNGSPRATATPHTCQPWQGNRGLAKHSGGLKVANEGHRSNSKNHYRSSLWVCDTRALFSLCNVIYWGQLHPTTWQACRAGRPNTAYYITRPVMREIGHKLSDIWYSLGRDGRNGRGWIMPAHQKLLSLLITHLAIPQSTY